MTNKLKHLRELVRRADSSEHYWQQQAAAMEFTAHGDWLLDRLEALEKVAQAARGFLNSDGDYFSWTEDERHCMSRLKEAVLAAEEKE